MNTLNASRTTSVTIDQVIAAHWGDCDVQEGETPEAYAMRHERRRLSRRRVLMYGFGWVVFSPSRTETRDESWRLEE
jgi:hypothetical protein